MLDVPWQPVLVQPPFPSTIHFPSSHHHPLFHSSLHPSVMPSITHSQSLRPSTDPQPPQALWTLAFDPVHPVFYAAGTDRHLSIYHLKEGGGWTLQSRFQTKHKKTIRSLDPHPFLPILALASFDGTISLWRPFSPSSSRGARGKGWKNVAVLEGTESEAKDVRWHPCRNLLATCGRDKSVWVWDYLPCQPSIVGQSEPAMDEFDCLAVLLEHSQDVKGAAWHPTLPVSLLPSSFSFLLTPFYCFSFLFTPDDCFPFLPFPSFPSRSFLVPLTFLVPCSFLFPLTPSHSFSPLPVSSRSFSLLLIASCSVLFLLTPSYSFLLLFTPSFPSHFFSSLVVPSYSLLLLPLSISSYSFSLP